MDKEEVFDLDDNGIEMKEVDAFGDNELVEGENRKKEEYEETEEFEEEEYEEEEPSPFMIVIILTGIVIAILVVIGVVFSFFKSEKKNEQSDIVMIETESEGNTEELTESESIEAEVQTDETIEEVFSEYEEPEQVETEETGTMEESMEEAEQNEETTIQNEPVSGNETMEFTELSDTVTAKDITNLRTVPSTLDETNVVAQLMNGEGITRTGINETYGWSRLDYNGQTVYAVSNYLTTDLNYKPPVAPNDPNRVSTQDGRVIIFTDYSDYITPKEYVNLRTEPSTSEGESTVRCQIKSGDTVHRTGYSPDSGWSRVEYNGEVLYVVSSMVYTTE